MIVPAGATEPGARFVGYPRLRSVRRGIFPWPFAVCAASDISLSGRRRLASLSFCLEQELLEESPELERRSGLSVAHRWNGAVIFSVERPIHDRRGSFTARPPLALPSPWSGRRARGRRVGP